MIHEQTEMAFTQELEKTTPGLFLSGENLRSYRSVMRGVDRGYDPAKYTGRPH